ncbi:MAG TPA: RcnB family protein [Caulobacteraceae bacterium]|nr:RcnB family protein [Caulobacteraceae bacterium]
MIRHALIATAALALIATPALADPPPWSHGRGHGGDNGPGATPPGLANKPYGMPPGQVKKAWRRGQYLPRAYFTTRSYYVLEPARYRLRPPPFGYRWVRVDGDYYLVQTRTGLIADLVTSLIR